MFWLKGTSGAQNRVSFNQVAYCFVQSSLEYLQESLNKVKSAFLKNSIAIIIAIIAIICLMMLLFVLFTSLRILRSPLQELQLTFTFLTYP